MRFVDKEHLEASEEGGKSVVSRRDWSRCTGRLEPLGLGSRGGLWPRVCPSSCPLSLYPQEHGLFLGRMTKALVSSASPSLRQLKASAGGRDDNLPSVASTRLACRKIWGGGEPFLIND